MAFKEKVGDIFVDLGMNMDKKSQKQTEKNLEKSFDKSAKGFEKRFEKASKNVANFLKKHAGKGLLIGAAVGAATASISKMNTQLTETTEHWSEINKLAKGFGISVEQMQQLQRAGTIANIPIQRLETLMDEIVVMQAEIGTADLTGEDSEKSDFIRQMGITGNETTSQALEIFLTSLKKTYAKDKNAARGLLDVVFPGFETGDLEALLEGGLIDALKQSKNEINTGRLNVLSQAKVNEIVGARDEKDLIDRNRLATTADSLNIEATLNAYKGTQLATERLEVGFNKATGAVNDFGKAIVNTTKKAKNYFSRNN